MELFLAIHITDDPLYLPTELSSLVRAGLPDIHMFQVDNYASPELLQAACRAVELADKLVIFVEAEPDIKSVNKLFSLLKKVVVHNDVYWIEKGENSLRMFRDMLKGTSESVLTEEEAVSKAGEFFKAG